MQETIHAHLGKGRRLVIPGEVCERYGLHVGAPVVMNLGNEGIEVLPLAKIIADAQEFFMSFPQGDKMWSEELLEDRRAEAAAEDRE